MQVYPGFNMNAIFLRLTLYFLQQVVEIHSRKKLCCRQIFCCRWQYLLAAFPSKTGSFWSPLPPLDVIISFSISRVHVATVSK